MMSDFRYEIKNFITCYLTWNFDTQKIRVGSYATNWRTDPGWSGWRRCWRIRPRTDPPNVLQCDLKKRKNIIHSSWSSWSIITFYIGYGNRINFFIQIFLMWSQINLCLSIRLTGGRQIDFKVSGHFGCQENI